MTLATPPSIEIEYKNYTLLIIDDNPTNLAVISEYLRLFGFQIMVARSGKSGLNRTKYVKPDLILLDVMMPGMDGFETCQRFKEIEKLQRVPIIFMTALTRAADKVKGFEVGAVDYITKPFQQEEVLARVTIHLKISDLTQDLEDKVAQLAQLNADLVATQSHLVEAKKMAALGGLVAGVAHEINTPVGIAITAASAFSDDLIALSTAYDNDEMSQEEFEEFLDFGKQFTGLIVSNLNQAANLVQSFKQVAVDQSSEEKRTFVMLTYLEEILLTLKPKLNRIYHTIQIECAENLTLYSHPGAWYQIVTNLVLNSVIHGYAEGEHSNLFFNIQTNNGELNFEYQDDGCGIPSENLDKIFAPFFTTRRGQGGSGLGLHIIYNLVTQRLGGTIRCESELGVGTKFIIDLPYITKATDYG